MLVAADFPRIRATSRKRLKEGRAKRSRMCRSIKAEQFADTDAIIFGTKTRSGNMTAQMWNMLYQTGGLWVSGALGKVGSVFTSTASRDGGQETTITSFHTTLLQHGMIIVGVRYTELAIARYQGKRVATIARQPKRGAVLRYLPMGYLDNGVWW